MYQFQLISLSEYVNYLLIFLWALTGLAFIGVPLSMLVDMSFNNDLYKKAVKAFVICLGSALTLSAILLLVALFKYLFTVVPQ